MSDGEGVRWQGAHLSCQFSCLYVEEHPLLSWPPVVLRSIVLSEQSQTKDAVECTPVKLAQSEGTVALKLVTLRSPGEAGTWDLEAVTGMFCAETMTKTMYLYIFTKAHWIWFHAFYHTWTISRILGKPHFSCSNAYIGLQNRGANLFLVP